MEYSDQYSDPDAEGEVDTMALVSVVGLPAPPTTNVGSADGGGVGKRYRPLSTKTFQCRGYGECRMVFSRSEHLARHIRKHTGERPFACHCNKQFSRLDNLRQHASTVHAEDMELNEAMMRELTALHASRTGSNFNVATDDPSSNSSANAADKKSAAKRRRASNATSNSSPVPPSSATGNAAIPSSAKIKRELTEPVLAAQRPGTSTGYEGAVDAESGHIDVDVKTDELHGHQAHSFRRDSFVSTNEFRHQDPRAFRAGAHAHSGANTDSAGSAHSFRGHPFARHTPSPPVPVFNGDSNRSPFQSSVAVPVPYGRAFQSSTTRSAFPSIIPSGSDPRPSTSDPRLPPLAAVVPAAAFRASSNHGRPALSSTGGILLPSSLTLRRPTTGDWDWDPRARPGTAPSRLAPAGVEDSPFSFDPPEQPAGGNSRKRTFSGADGPYRDGAQDDEGHSRPTSRRFSVMDLCNDDAGEQRPASSALAVPLPRRSGSAERKRPTTTGGLVLRASALVLHDHQQRERERESRWGAGEQCFTADRFALGVGAAGRVRARDVEAPGGAIAAGARAGGGGPWDGGVPGADAGGELGSFPPSSASRDRAAVPERAGVLPNGTNAPGVSGWVPASPRPGARARDGYGRDEDGDGDGDGDDESYAAASIGHGGSGRASRSPPDPVYRDGSVGGTLFSGIAGIPYAPASSTTPAARPSAVSSFAVYARVPAYAAGLLFRGDALCTGQRPDDGFRCVHGGHAEVREFGGHSADGYEHEHEYGYRLGGGMKV